VIEVRVAHLGLDRTTNTPVVILQEREGERVLPIWIGPAEASAIAMELAGVKFADRKSTRLNSSHSQISYAVFCLKKKKKEPSNTPFTDRTVPASLQRVSLHASDAPGSVLACCTARHSALQTLIRSLMRTVSARSH